MQVLMSAIGSRGDVQPMLTLALALREAGHGVRLCAPPNFERWILQHGIEFHACGRDLQAWLHDRSDQAKTPWGVIREMNGFLRDELEVQHRCLEPLMADADVLLYTGLSVVAPSLAEARGIPRSFIIFCPQLLPSRAHPHVQVRAQWFPGWLNMLSHRVMFRLMSGVLRPGVNRHRQALGLEPVRRLEPLWLGEHVLLACDPVLAEVPPDAPVRVSQVGAFQITDIRPLDPMLEAFLADGPPPVYVGFGSMIDPDPTYSRRLVAEVTAALGVRAVICQGWTRDRTGLPEHCLVVDEVPHSSLFPQTAAIVHHGGAGTMSTALRSGVPQVVVPFMLDQYYWGARVARAGLGPDPIARTRLTRRRLERALRRCLTDSAMQARARTVAGLLDDRGPSRAVTLIEEMVGKRA